MQSTATEVETETHHLLTLASIWNYFCPTHVKSSNTNDEELNASELNEIKKIENENRLMVYFLRKVNN